MTRGEKIGAVLVGVLLFAGLAFFIFDALRPADRFATDAGYGDTFDDELDYAVEEDTGAVVPADIVPADAAPKTPAKK